MFSISVYQPEDNRYYQVNVDVNANVLDRVDGSSLAGYPGQLDYYLSITTTMRKAIDNSAFPSFIARTLADVPPGYGTASNFTELVDDYVEYFITQAEMGMSTSSSSSSSSSSSFGYSESSSSSSTYIRSSSSSSSSLSSSSSSSLSSESSLSSDSSESSSSSLSSLSSESSLSSDSSESSSSSSTEIRSSSSSSSSSHH